eukprot:4764128-Prymnesium_polylepis.1
MHAHGSVQETKHSKERHGGTCSNFRVAMMIPCLLNRATRDISCDHTTYLTMGVLSSANALRC